VATNGHPCNSQGKIQTWKRQRTTPEYDMVVMATTAHHREIVERTARTILRIKGRVCRVSVQLQTQASATHIRLYPVTVPGAEAANAAPSILSVRRPPRSLTPCLQRSGIYSNRRKTIQHGASSDEHPATPYSVLAGER
jgi:hypothetical protein